MRHRNTPPAPAPADTTPAIPPDAMKHIAEAFPETFAALVEKTRRDIARHNHPDPRRRAAFPFAPGRN